MKLIVILALIAVASAIPGCAYFQNAEACFSGIEWGDGTNAGIPYCKVYGADPYTCATCFPGLEWSATSLRCIRSTAFYNWTYWPTTSTADATAQADSQNCLNYHVQYASAITYNYEGSLLSYTWNYENMSCVINGQQVCQTCKPGWRWDATTFKCVACPTACKTCSLVGTTNTCSVCNESFFLATNTCTACGTGMLSCTAADKALTCKSGYFKDGDKCTGCQSTTSTLTCTSATVATKCVDGNFLDAGKCTACGQDNIGTCSALLVAGITTCNAATVATNTIYKHTDGCIAHASSNKCATLLKTGATYYCGSCFTGYFRNGGVCVTYESVCLYSSDNLTYSAACATLSNQSLLTSVTVACKTGYYLELRTGNAGINKCRKCTNSQANCGLTGGCVADGVTNAPKCDTSAATNYFLNGAAPLAATACGTYYGTGCATCSTVGCLTLTSDTTYFLCYRKLGGTNSDVFTKKVSCVKAYSTTAPATATDSLDGSAGITDATHQVTDCDLFELDATIATQYNCTKCVRSSDKKVVITKVTALGGSARVDIKQTCVKGGSDGTAPVNEAKWKFCLQASTNDLTVNTGTRCARCDTANSIAGATSADGCTEVTTPVTNCDKHSSQTICETCASTHQKTATGDKCATKVAGCLTHLTPAAGVTTAVCDVCNENYIKKSDGTACYQCSLTTNYLRCTEFKINIDDNNCGCKTCAAGYFVDSITTLCSNTNDAAKNCYQLSLTMTGAWACAVCNYGYKFVTTECKLCTATGTNCVYTGCASQAYINKPTTPAGAATSYSSIISFLIMTLVALMTFMI